jgi:PAS domain S-box-containing protein
MSDRKLLDVGKVIKDLGMPIVSKTDMKGKITEVNDAFLKITGFKREDVIGKPHNIIRHPDMPKSAFSFVWDTLKNGNTWSGFVLNKAPKGEYWVYAIISPNYDRKGMVYGYTSMRYEVNPDALNTVKNLYSEMLKAEKENVSNKEEIIAGSNILSKTLNSAGVEYDFFVRDLQKDFGKDFDPNKTLKIFKKSFFKKLFIDLYPKRWTPIKNLGFRIKMISVLYRSHLFYSPLISFIVIIIHIVINFI